MTDLTVDNEKEDEGKDILMQLEKQLMSMQKLLNWDFLQSILILVEVSELTMMEVKQPLSQVLTIHYKK